MMDNIRTGVIGIGNMGSAHAVSLGEGHIQGMTLAAAADLDPARLSWVKSRFPQTAVFTDPSAMLASGLVDAVIIATPHYFHALLAVEAFQKGLHVLSEKPGGVYTRQVREMIDAHKKAGTVFGVMFNQRTSPLFQKARQIVQSGELGEPKRLVWIITNWYRLQSYYDSGSWRASWKGEGGGVLLNQAPHNLDLWQWIFGMPKRVFASCACGKYHHVEVEDDATILAEYENGATASFMTTTGEYPGTNRLEIAGDRGKLVLENGVLKHWTLPAPERAFCFSLADAAAIPQPAYSEFTPDRPETAHRGILQNFANAIRNGTPLLAPGEDALNELTISNAAYLSSWEQRWIDLPLDEADFEAELQKRVRTSKLKSGAAPEEQNGCYKTRWSVSW